MIYKITDKQYIKETYSYQYKLEADNGAVTYILSTELKEKVESGEIELKNYSLDKYGRLNKLYEEELEGKEFGKWKVLRYAGDSKWECQCQCEYGTIRNIPTSSLKSGRATNCKNCASDNRREDLSGRIFGDWTVLEYVGNKSYKCQCSCENKTIRVIQAQTLRSGASKSCGHNTSKFKDLSGQQFGLWKVLKYEGNGMWKCECQCENKTVQSLYGGSLRAGRTTSCGCNKETKRLNTLVEKYNETSTVKLNNPREDWQLEAISSKDKLLEYINTFEYKPTITELANKLGVTYSSIHRFVDDEVAKYLSINDFSSYKETEIYNYIKELIPDLEIIRNSRNIISPHELDIYIPDKKVAIEFNGNYWHSVTHKDKYYHQEKTVECINRGIRLIHIFEYEWDSDDKNRKIKKYLRDILTDAQKIYARNTNIVEKTSAELREFLIENHMQGAINSSINIALEHNNEIVGALTLGKPRFNSNFDYEVHRLCFKSGVKVVGGFSKLFKYFVNKYLNTGDKVISYIDLSKFTGESYIKNGFKLINPVEYISEPNYIWYNTSDKSVLNRYNTQKHKLIESGLGNEGDTEDTIMDKLGYLKIYDSGNLKLVYNN